LVKIRLRRMGAKKRPSYRIVVADARSPRDGRFIETIGHYDPLTEPATIVIDLEKAQKWISQGAQPTKIVTKLIHRARAAGGAGSEPGTEPPAATAQA
jgi:small subunit ribosomal protein S16